jgi:hypothetical protein
VKSCACLAVDRRFRPAGRSSAHAGHKFRLCAQWRGSSRSGSTGLGCVRAGGGVKLARSHPCHCIASCASGFKDQVMNGVVEFVLLSWPSVLTVHSHLSEPATKLGETRCAAPLPRCSAEFVQLAKHFEC